MFGFVFLWLIPFILVLTIGRFINSKVNDNMDKISLSTALFLALFGIVGLIILLVIIIFTKEYRNEKMNDILTYISNKYKE